MLSSGISCVRSAQAGPRHPLDLSAISSPSAREGQSGNPRRMEVKFAGKSRFPSFAAGKYPVLNRLRRFLTANRERRSPSARNPSRLYEMQEHLLPMRQVWSIRPSCHSVSCISYAGRRSRASDAARTAGRATDAAQTAGRASDAARTAGRANGRSCEYRARERPALRVPGGLTRRSTRPEKSPLCSIRHGARRGASGLSPPEGARADVDTRAALGESVP